MAKIYKSEAGARAVRERTVELLARWPVPNQQLRVPTREGETFVIACGPEGAPALLLLHGSGASAVTFMGAVETWSPHFRVYAIDMIGEPGLSAPSRPPLDSEAHALWLDDVLRELSVARASFIGTSLGGWLAVDYATRRPGRVERMALLCPGGIGRQRTSFLLKALPLLLLGRWGRRKALRVALGATPGGEGATEAGREVAEYLNLVFTHFRPRMTTLPVFDDAALRSLTMPVLAIVGTRDAILDSADTARRLERTVPHAAVCLLPEVGHFIWDVEKPVLDFLLH